MEEVHGHSYGLTASGMARTKASHLDLGDVNAHFSLEMRQGGPEQSPGPWGTTGIRAVSRLIRHESAIGRPCRDYPA